jgi:hypothetical protein
MRVDERSTVTAPLAEVLGFYDENAIYTVRNTVRTAAILRGLTEVCGSSVVYLKVRANRKAAIERSAILRVVEQPSHYSLTHTLLAYWCKL